MKRLDYLTDIIDRYANMASDGRKLSSEQNFQLFECVVELNRMNGISEDTRERWVTLAHDIVKNSKKNK